MWLLLVSCLHSAPAPAVRATEIAAEADELWARRDEIGLLAAGEPLVRAQSTFIGGPGVAWRLTRWFVARGMAEDDDVAAMRLFADGRERAIACLDQSPNFSAWHAAGDWEAAARAVPPVRRACAAWGALAWMRWLELQGPAAASVDLPAIDALITAGSLAEGENIREIAAWADGLALALRPEWDGRDLAGARAQLERAVRGEPTSVVRRADLYALVLLPAGTPAEQAAALAQIQTMRAPYPEDVTVQARWAAPR